MKKTNRNDAIESNETYPLTDKERLALLVAPLLLSISLEMAMA